MKNITIKLDDDVAHWSRVWAAEHNTSVSQIMSDLLRDLKRQKVGYAQAMQDYLAVEPQALKTDSNYPTRDSIYER